jgi:ribosome-associated protein
MDPSADRIVLDESEIVERFVRSSGPGGQHVNKVATAVQLRYDLKNARSLPDEVRKRLRRMAGNRVTAEGVLILEARRFRSREKNRRDARERLLTLIRKAWVPPRPRRKTGTPQPSREHRLSDKRRRSEVKKTRGGVSSPESG